MDVSSDSRLAAARKRECAKCAKYDRINACDELDGRTACCGCMRTHRDNSVCFSASLRLDDSRFHFGMCNDCVHTLTVEAGSTPLLRTFKTFSVPGAAAAAGRSDAGGSIPDPTTPEGTLVDLGNGVMVTATTPQKVDAEEEKEGGGGGGGEGVERALPPPVVDVWSVRRVAAKAKAAYASLPSASAGVAVTAAAAAAVAVAATVAAAARSASSASASYALTPANVDEMGGGRGEGGGAQGGGAERSPRPRRPNKLDDGDSKLDNRSCKSSSDGSGSTAPNSLEDKVKFFLDGGSGSSGSSGSSGGDGGSGGSLASASRTSSSGDMGIDMAVAAAAAAVAASLQEYHPQQQQQQLQQGMTPSSGVRARAQALERKLAGLEDAPTLSMKGGSETPVGVGGRSVSGGSSSGVVGNLSGRAVVVAGGGDEGERGRACGSRDGGGGGGGGEEGMGKERKQAETGGGRRSRLFYCGVAAVGVGLVGAAVWAFGGRPSRR